MATPLSILLPRSRNQRYIESVPWPVSDVKPTLQKCPARILIVSFAKTDLTAKLVSSRLIASLYEEVLPYAQRRSISSEERTLRAGGEGIEGRRVYDHAARRASGHAGARQPEFTTPRARGDRAHSADPEGRPLAPGI